jgi:hypothetical protein
MATRMVETAVCSEAFRNNALIHTGISTSAIADYRGPQSSPHDQRFCVVNVPEDPALPPLVVERTSEHVEPWFGLPLDRRSTTVIMPDGISYTLKGGLAGILSWWPLPIAGCYSTGSSPHGETMECTARFYRNIVQLVGVDEGTRGDDVALAAALGLKRVAPADREATTSPELARTLIAAALQRVVALEISDLDRVTADPAMAISSVPFENLPGRLDIIQPRLDPIVAAIEQGIQLGEKHETTPGRCFVSLRRFRGMRLRPIWTGSRPSAPETVRLCSSRRNRLFRRGRSARLAAHRYSTTTFTTSSPRWLIILAGDAAASGGFFARGRPHTPCTRRCPRPLPHGPEQWPRSGCGHAPACSRAPARRVAA